MNENVQKTENPILKTGVYFKVINNLSMIDSQIIELFSKYSYLQLTSK
jgi:hypothetical protein